MAKKVIYVPSCHSTNQLAEQLLADSDIYEGTVVITDHQKKGKGRMNKIWESRKGENLTLSVVLKPAFLELESQFHLNIFSSLAVSKTIARIIQVAPEIKWPNDVMVNGRKISGILIKNILKGKKIGASIVGIGLNINQTEFQEKNATSFRNLSKMKHDLNDVFSVLMENIEHYYLLLRESSFDKLEMEYHHSLYGLNREIMFDSGEQFMGIIRGVDKKGHLLVERSGEVVKFNLNEIKYTSPPQ